MHDAEIIHAYGKICVSHIYLAEADAIICDAEFSIHHMHISFIAVLRHSKPPLWN